MLIPIDRLVALDKWLIDDWRQVIFHLWSIRIAIFWAAISGIFAVWPAFMGIIPLWPFAAGSVIMSIALVIARLTKQDDPPAVQPSELDK